MNASSPIVVKESGNIMLISERQFENASSSMKKRIDAINKAIKSNEINEPNYLRVAIEPLEKGFGTTLGNALRRVMLSSMPGSAIVAVKIDGVMHEFQTIDGIVEDVTAIILNLKNIVVKKHVEEDKVLHLTVNEERIVTAADIETDADVEIINKDQVIATLSKGGKLDMELIVSSGRGYVPSNENKKFVENNKLGFIPIDALYSPIERISYDVDSARVGQDANYDNNNSEEVSETEIQNIISYFIEIRLDSKSIKTI